MAKLVLFVIVVYVVPLVFGLSFLKKRKGKSDEGDVFLVLSPVLNLIFMASMAVKALMDWWNSLRIVAWIVKWANKGKEG